ncbi:Two component transcriptional regulator, LuxR family [Gammaproteobacteria bacterium]
MSKVQSIGVVLLDFLSFLETAMNTTTIILADDHRLFREGLHQVCTVVGKFNVVGQAASGEEAVRMARELKPEIILMDVQMPGMGGIPATAAITAENSRIGVIILTMYRQDSYLFEAIKAGARGYLLKDCSGDEAIAAIREVARRGVIMPPEMAAMVFEEFRRVAGEGNHPPEERLTTAEMDVLVRGARGEENQRIAEALNITVKTVANRLYTIYCKLHVKNRTQAALAALRKGWAEL